MSGHVCDAPEASSLPDAARPLISRGDTLSHLPFNVFEFSGFERIRAKTAAPGVEALARLLEPRCQTEDLAARLRTAVVSYVDNGGVLSMPVLAVPVAGDVPAAECEAGDAGCDAPTPVLRHRLLEQGFRLNSKAFMLTFNCRAFTEAT